MSIREFREEQFNKDPAFRKVYKRFDWIDVVNFFEYVWVKIKGFLSNLTSTKK